MVNFGTATSLSEKGPAWCDCRYRESNSAGNDCVLSVGSIRSGYIHVIGIIRTSFSARRLG